VPIRRALRERGHEPLIGHRPRSSAHRTCQPTTVTCCDHWFPDVSAANFAIQKAVGIFAVCSSVVALMRVCAGALAAGLGFARSFDANPIAALFPPPPPTRLTPRVICPLSDRVLGYFGELRGPPCRPCGCRGSRTAANISGQPVGYASVEVATAIPRRVCWGRWCGWPVPPYR